MKGEKLSNGRLGHSTAINKRVKNSLFSWRNYFLFFFLIGVSITVSFYLFFYFTDIEITDITASAAITLGNVLFISLISTSIYGIWRNLNFSRPVNRILDGTDRIREGKFGEKIEPFHIHEQHYNELDLIIDNLNIMSEELSNVETLRTDFIANVSHELKTPLASIQNYATLLQDETLSDDERIEYSRAISLSSRHLSELITNILRLNKLENQEIFPNLKTFDLSEQLVQSILNYEDQWEAKNINVDAEIPENVMIESDEDLLSIIWNNLLSNAAKFTPENGTVSVSLEANKGSILVKIKDTGIGMSPDVQRHIFEKFYQGDTSHAMKGNGLGLALAKRISDIAGGEIQVESQPDEGTEFTVILPHQKPV